MINCEPVIETTQAKVAVDSVSLQVQDYQIMGDPIPFLPAFADNFIQHEQLIEVHDFVYNYTTSFGPLFVSALLTASQIGFLGGCSDSSGATCSETTSDRVFNHREPGLNVDYMSYAMLALANNDVTSLLNYDTMTKHAQTVFSTFFKHFASSTVPLDGAGGWVYQRPTETLPADLMPAQSPYNQVDRAPAAVAQAVKSSMKATLLEPVEVLQVSPIAVWLSLFILLWLIVAALLLLIVKDRYMSPLRRRVDTIADVAVLVAGSERYLELARSRGETGLRLDKNFRTRLGWFRTDTGQIRWGIELADDPKIEFLTEKEVEEYQGTLDGGYSSGQDLTPQDRDGSESHELRTLRGEERV